MGQSLHRGGTGQFHFLGLEQILELDVVDLTVAAHQDGHGLAVHAEKHGFDHSLGRNPQHGRHFLHAVRAGGIDFFIVRQAPAQASVQASPFQTTSARSTLAA